MDQKIHRLYPSASLENKVLEQRLEKKLNVVKCFNNLTSNIKEMTTYFKDKNHKSKKKYRIYKILNTKIEVIDTIVIIGAMSTSITSSINGIDLIVFRISDGTARTLSLGNKVLQKLIINKYNEYKKQFERDQQSIKSFENYTENLYKIM